MSFSYTGLEVKYVRTSGRQSPVYLMCIVMSPAPQRSIRAILLPDSCCFLLGRVLLLLPGVQHPVYLSLLDVSYLTTYLMTLTAYRAWRRSQLFLYLCMLWQNMESGRCHLCINKVTVVQLWSQILYQLTVIVANGSGQELHAERCVVRHECSKWIENAASVWLK